MALTKHLHGRHRGLVPDDQLATGTAGSGDVPISDGAGSRAWGAPSGGGSLTVKDEGSSLATAATSLDFVGAGVTASGTGAAKTITITGGGSDFTHDTPAYRFPVASGFEQVAQEDLGDGTNSYLDTYGGFAQVYGTDGANEATVNVNGTSPEVVIDADGTYHAKVSVDGSSGSILIKSFSGTKDILLDAGNATVDVDGASGGVTITAQTDQLNLQAFGSPPAGLVQVAGNGFVPPLLSADPSSPVEGQMYHNYTTHKTRVYDGTVWRDLW